MRTFDVATVGDNCIDRYLSPISVSMIGGNAVNVAVHLQRQSLNVAYFGAVGADDEGHRLVACLEDNGVATQQVRVTPGRTAYTDIQTDDDGERTIEFEDFGVCWDYRPEPAEVQRLLTMRHVHLGWLNDGGGLRRTLTREGVSVSQDVSVNAEPGSLGVGGLSIAFASAGPSLERAEVMLAQMLAEGARLAVVTRGALGSIASDGGQRAETSVAPVEVVDTTGAGDTFIAGFIAAHLRGDGLQVGLEAGRDLAASTCAHLGGFPQPGASLQLPQDEHGPRRDLR
jgi:fructoselysine 6-kinase